MKRELEAVKITDNHDAMFKKKKKQLRLLFHMKETQRKENKQR